jgi:hypothetical protein
LDALWNVEWPELNAEALTTLARWVAGLLVAAGIVALLSRRTPAILSRCAGCHTRRAARPRSSPDLS